MRKKRLPVLLQKLSDIKIRPWKVSRIPEPRYVKQPELHLPKEIRVYYKHRKHGRKKCKKIIEAIY